MRTLAEIYFIEFAGFKKAGKLGKGLGGVIGSSSGRTLIKKLATSGASGSKADQIAYVKKNPELKTLAIKAGQSTSAKVGQIAGQAALGGAYVGAAFLAYKGLMKLKDRFSKSQNPQEKQNIQKQIDQGQAKLQRAKELNKVKQKQESDKRQREAKG